ncbi:2,5-dichlorohydroquinone reductive dechlorinase [Pseudomonas fluorescens]|uniref:glutathione S-transferase family protein n=1 Tax=Pseudomonas fluorescens TaxID=294 RepID=UPI0012599E60|nr:glutathione S-transferase domain-containing protein [Pseudomonas fluorescens]VVO23119.1 2,5-dichlorohydroquinone reductive dechlorinase [Pseudomonas fluorescens]
MHVDNTDAMVSNEQLMKMAAAARAAIVDPARITLVGDDPNPRFELFHAASSLCSQKVRTVLFEKGLSYRSNDMIILCAMGVDGIIPAEHYSPAYVRLRLIAGRELNQEFVTRYSGRTSVETEGFDPCVVPLLIDYEVGRVIVDSKRICCYLDAVSREGGQLLCDEAQARAEVVRQVDIVDRIPNGALLYGFHPDDDRRPDILKSVMETVYDCKIIALEALAAANAGEPALVAAYRAKIAKESGGKMVCHDAEFQRAARKHVANLLTELDHALAAKSFPWPDGNSFSLGDVVWGVNLVRLAYLGLASMWDELPNVARYVDALTKRPSLCKEAIQASIDSLPPSSYLNALVARRA